MLETIAIILVVLWILGLPHRELIHMDGSEV
jgi:hypothetical protein